MFGPEMFWCSTIVIFRVPRLKKAWNRCRIGSYIIRLDVLILFLDQSRHFVAPQPHSDHRDVEGERREHPQGDQESAGSVILS
jgi:hypothetical protein